MKVGDKVKIINYNNTFDEKEGFIEEVDEVNESCTVFVEFLPGKNVRQDFSFENLELIENSAEIDYSEEDDDVSHLSM